MTVKDHPDGKIIALSQGLDTRPKMLHVFYFTVFFLTGLLFLKYFILEGEVDNIFVLLLLLLFPAGSFLAAYRFANKVIQSEKLIVSKNSLTIIKGGIFSAQKKVYDINLIENFRHLAQTPISKHPLAGESIDYLGFETGQHLANNLHGDNRLAFDYNGSTIKFGENIFSWDFEQLEVIIYDVTGKEFKSLIDLKASLMRPATTIKYQ
jgi:hypothetical protein